MPLRLAPRMMVPIASRVMPLDPWLLPDGVDPALAWAEQTQQAAAALVGSAGARLFVLAESTGRHGGDLGQSLHEARGSQLDTGGGKASQRPLGSPLQPQDTPSGGRDGWTSPYSKGKGQGQGGSGPQQ